jgi:virginiamycin B lyase
VKRRPALLAAGLTVLLALALAAPSQALPRRYIAYVFGLPPIEVTKANYDDGSGLCFTFVNRGTQAVTDLQITVSFDDKRIPKAGLDFRGHYDPGAIVENKCAMLSPGAETFTVTGRVDKVTFADGTSASAPAPSAPAPPQMGTITSPAGTTPAPIPIALDYCQSRINRLIDTFKVSFQGLDVSFRNLTDTPIDRIDFEMRTPVYQQFSDAGSFAPGQQINHLVHPPQPVAPNMMLMADVACRVTAIHFSDGRAWAPLVVLNGTPLQADTTVQLVRNDALVAYAGLNAIAIAGDGTVWVAELGPNHIAHVSAAGTMLAEYTMPTRASGPAGLAFDRTGAIWFTEEFGNRIGRIAPDGTIKEFALPRPDTKPAGIALGTDGRMWFTEGNWTGGIELKLKYNAHMVGAIAADGSVAEYPLDGPGAFATNIVAGPGDTMWFLDGQTIVKLRLDGTVANAAPLPATSRAALLLNHANTMTLYAIVGSTPQLFTLNENAPVARTLDSTSLAISRLTSAPDGSLWFVQSGRNSIGRISSTGAVALYDLGDAKNAGGARPAAIAVAPDGTVWFTESAVGKLIAFKPKP